MDSQDLTAHNRALRSIARELVGATGPWEDLVQGTYLTALERPPSKLSFAWLAHVLRNRAIDHHRRRAKEGSASDRSAQSPPADGGPGSEEIMQRLELHEGLLRAVRSLDEPYKTTVFLRYFEEQTPLQIAERLGVPVKTVKTRLSRGLAELRRRLEGEFGAGRDGWMAAILPLAYPWVAPATGATVSTTTTGIGVLMKKLVLITTVLLGALGLYHFGSEAPALPPELSPETVGEVAVAELPQVEGPKVQESVEQREVVAAPEEAPEPPDPAPLTEASSLLVNLIDPQGKPAENVAVALNRHDRSGPRRGIGQAVSDSGGSVLFEDLEAGQYYLYLERALGRFVTVELGKRKEIDVQLDSGTHVVGQVVDEAGKGVAHANIWQTNGCKSWLGGRVVARADAAGHFELEHATSGQSLGALANGYAPSDLVDLDLIDPKQSPKEVTLLVAARGGALTGTLRDPNGEVVSDAIVTLGVVGGSRYGRLGGGREEAWTPQVARSDEQGRFRFESVPAGSNQVAARAPGHPILQQTIEVAPLGDTQCELQFASSARLHGRVLDEAGQPVPGAIVRAFDLVPNYLDADYVDRGQFNYTGTFQYRFGVADESGVYSIDLLNPGEVQVYAHPPDNDDEELQAHAVQILTLWAGKGTELNPVLSHGLTISGSITFKDGTPIDDLFINARHEETKKYHAVRTTSEGKFRFVQLDDATYTIRIQAWPRVPEELTRDLVAYGVRPGDPDVVFVTPENEPVVLEAGSVRGQVEDVAGRLVAEPSANLLFEVDSSWKICEYKDGHFHFEDVVPGGYRLMLLSGEDMVYVGELIEVGEGEHIDLGVVKTQAAAELVVDLRWPEGVEPSPIEVGVQPADGWFDYETVENPLLHELKGLNAGPHRLRVRGKEIGAQTLPIELNPGEALRVEVAIQPAVLRTVEIWAPEGVGLARAKLLIRDGAGELLGSKSPRVDRMNERPLRLTHLFPVGGFQLEVEASNQLGARLEVNFDSLEGAESPIRIDLE